MDSLGAGRRPRPDGAILRDRAAWCPGNATGRAGRTPGRTPSGRPRRSAGRASRGRRSPDPRRRTRGRASRDAVEVHAARTLLARKPIARKKRTAGRSSGPGDGADGRAPVASAASVDDAAPEPLSPMVRLDRDEVERSLVRPVGAEEPEQEAHRGAIRVLGEERRAREVAEPRPPDERPDATTAEPVIDPLGDPRLVVLGGPAENDRLTVGLQRRVAHVSATPRRPSPPRR